MRLYLYIITIFIQSLLALTDLNYKYIESIENLPSNTSVVYYNHLSQDYLNISSHSKRLRSIEIIFQIKNGTFYHRGTIQCPTIADEYHKLFYGFYLWEYHCPESSTHGTILDPIYYNAVMTLNIAWGNVFSHIIGTLLPKLSFTCEWLGNNTHVLVSVDSSLAKDLVCEYCPSTCNRLFISANGFHAAHLYVPLFYCNHQMKTGVAELPRNVLRSLHRPSKQNMTRSFVYLPRENTPYRRVVNQKEMLTRLCTYLRYPLSIVRMENNYTLDRRSDIHQAIAVLSPHGGSLANLIFAPQDVKVIELIDLSTGNWFYAALSGMLNLSYHPVRPKTFSMFEKTQIVVDIDVLLDTLRTIPNLLDNETGSTEQKSTCLEIVQRAALS